MSYAYRVEVIPMDPGRVGEILAEVAAEGWRLHSALPTVVSGGSPLVPGPARQQPALYCVFERAGGAAAAPAPETMVG